MRDQILFYFNKNVVLPRKSHHDPLITGQILTALDADEQILQRYLPHITLMRTKSRKVITNIDFAASRLKSFGSAPCVF